MQSMSVLKFFGVALGVFIIDLLYKGVFGEPCITKVFANPVANKVLINHVISSPTVTSVEVCEIKCFLDFKCESYNFGPKEGGGHVCELSDSDAIRDPLDWTTKQGFIYHGTKNPCANVQCPLQARCHSDFENDSHACVCLSGFTGNNCEPAASTVPPEIQVACFIEADNLNEELGDFTNEINWDNTDEVVKKCAKLAHAKDYKRFALGKNGLCLYGEAMKHKYHLSGFEGAHCQDGIGMDNSIFVYSFDPAPNLQPLGCYNDSTNDRALPVLYANVRNQINWTKMELTVNQCARVAHDIGYEYFAVQYYGECYGGRDAGNSYAKYGNSTAECWWFGEQIRFAVGKEKSNFVYRIK